MRGVLAAVGIGLGLLPGCGNSGVETAPSRIAESQPLHVTRVIDGDTLRVDGVGTIRLIGVDTPETSEYFSKEATDFLKQLGTGRQVRLEFDQDRTDRFGRTLAYVFLHPENLHVNAEIVRQGYGFAYTQFPFRRIEEFRALEREARDAGRGLWAAR